MTDVRLTYFDRELNLVRRVVDVPAEHGAFCVAPPIARSGALMEGLWSIYHVPSGLALIPIACTSRLMMTTLATRLGRGQHYASTWLSKYPGQLRKDRRIKEQMEAVWATVRACDTCRAPSEEELNEL